MVYWEDKLEELKSYPQATKKPCYNKDMSRTVKTILLGELRKKTAKKTRLERELKRVVIEEEELEAEIKKQ